MATRMCRQKLGAQIYDLFSLASTHEDQDEHNRNLDNIEILNQEITRHANEFFRAWCFFK